MKSRIEITIEALEASRETLQYQLRELTKFYSAAQVAVWRQNLRRVNTKLEFFKGIQKAHKAKLAQDKQARKIKVNV